MKQRDDGTWGPEAKTLGDAGPVDAAAAELGGDFEPLSVLGAGGGGRVYLARQRSLNRLVALKVVSDSAAEANTLAKLEHENIVSVFSESIEPDRGRRIICMQYVPGTTLGKVIRLLWERKEEPTGAAVLAAIDALSVGHAPLEPGLLAERAALERADAITATCLIGAKLARALAHAHGRSVVHRDVKPGNILLTPYGRPMLVDFNIAASASTHTESPFGATLRYASPEQLAALAHTSSRAVVDARADLYSFGIVLFELLTGESPFQGSTQAVSLEAQQALRAGALRRVGRSERSARVLQRVLRRCLASDPERRYQSADELAAALDACAALRGCEQELPPAGGITLAAQKNPMGAVFITSLLPHLAGMAVVAVYVTELVLKTLNERQVRAYLAALAVFAATVLPLGGVVAAYLVRRVARSVERLRAPGATGADATEARRRLLEMPRSISSISFGAWVLSIPYFPTFVGVVSDPVPPGVAIHIAVFTLLCAVIGAVYTGIFPLHVTLRLILPWTTIDGRDLAAPMNLALLPRRLRALQLVSAACLPTSAVIGLAFWPDPMGAGVRLMLGTLLWVGALGAGGAMYSAAEAIFCAEAVERLRARVAK